MDNPGFKGDLQTHADEEKAMKDTGPSGPQTGNNLAVFDPKEAWAGGPGVLIDATEKDPRRREMSRSESALRQVDRRVYDHIPAW